MKKILLVLAILASMQAFDAQAQPKSAAAAKSAVEKAEAATVNPKQNTKTATWIKYGQSLLDAYSFPSGNAWVGMGRAEYDLVSSGVKPISEETVVLNGAQYTKATYADKVLYFNANNQLEVIDVTAPVVENALGLSLDAYKKAQELDPKGSKTKDISNGIQDIATKYSEEAYSKYTLGDYSAASSLFEKAAEASATAPLNVLDTNSVYNAAYTAWAAGENDRAVKFFNECLSFGYAGSDGDVYAKLADIASKGGDQEASKKYLEEGFTKYPQSQGILVGLINYYISSGEETSRLFELLDVAKQNEPNNASLYYVEGNIRAQLGQGDEAVAAYRKCTEIDPSYEFGFIGEGIYWYNKAIELQDKAAEELDDAKYTALMGEFETALKACIEPFEKGFEATKDAEVKVGVAEYLRNACFRFRTQDPEMQAKYDKYNAAASQQ